VQIKIRGKRRKIFIFALATVAVIAVATAGYLIIRAASLSVSDTFDTPQKIATKTNATVCGGQVKLAESSWTTLTECNCNAISGWYWYTTNGRSACWSKTLADSTSWNKGVGDNTTSSGTYTCATAVTALKDRMAAASAGEWYKIVSDVNGVAITSAKNGSAGYSSISALAISDCTDGTRDLAVTLGADYTAANASLKTWAGATGNKSALTYCNSSGCDTAVNSDYRAACEANINTDIPLSCYQTNIFYLNQKTCNDGDTNYMWAAAAYSGTGARVLGVDSCATVYYYGTSNTGSYGGFRVVVRP
jgi:hypothetical protein